MTNPNPDFKALIGKRSAARLAAVQALYQYDLNEQSIDRIIGEFVTQHLGKEIDGVEYKDADAEFFADLARQTVKQRDAIDEQLATAISVRDADRVETLLRAIMRVGAFELMGRKDVPAKVVITEYVDVAHAFYGGAEPGLVNAVLDRVARAVRPEEFSR